MSANTLSLAALEECLRCRIQDPYAGPEIVAADIIVGGTVVIGFIDHYGERYESWRITRQEDGTFLVETDAL